MSPNTNGIVETYDGEFVLVVLPHGASCWRAMLAGAASPRAGKRHLDLPTHAHAVFALAGFTGQQMFNQGVCYTYDDCIFHPGHINFGAHEVSKAD